MTLAASTGMSPAQYASMVWQSVGGHAGVAPIAAAVAQAESGGNPTVVSAPNKNGTVDVGLWQINSSHIGESYTVNGQSFTISSVAWLQNPQNNAMAASALSSNGLNWKPWCTAYGDGACGTAGGKYLATSSPFVKYLSGGSSNPAYQNLVKLAGTAPGSLGPNATATLAADVGAAGGSTVEANNCLIKAPSLLGGSCLWYPSWNRALIGALSLGGGALLGLGVAFYLGKSALPKFNALPVSNPTGSQLAPKPAPLSDQDLADLNTEVATKRQKAEGESEGQRQARRDAARRRRAQPTTVDSEGEAF